MSQEQAIKTTASDDFSRQPVPEEKTYSGLHIALIVVGGTIGIGVFIMAAQIGGALGLADAAMAFAIGSLILGVMGMFTGLSGQRSRFSTYMIAEFSFGRHGAKLVNLVIAMSLIGWYGVISNVFGQAANSALSDLYGWTVPVWLCVLVGSVLMIGVTLSGFKGIDKLALFLVPFMVAFIGYAAIISWDAVPDWTLPVQNAEPFNFSLAVSAVVGTYISGVIIMPDYSRFARNGNHAIWSAFIALGVIFPILLFSSAVPGAATGQSDMVKVLLALGIGLPAFLLLLLATWSSNVLCLYSSGLSFSTIFTRLKLWKIILTIGVIGTALAFMRAQEYFINFLVLLGITIPPIGAIYIIDILLIRRGQCDPKSLLHEPVYNWRAFCAWGIGVLCGYLTAENIVSLTGIASTDSIVFTIIVFLALNVNRLKARG